MIQLTETAENQLNTWLDSEVIKPEYRGCYVLDDINTLVFIERWQLLILTVQPQFTMDGELAYYHIHRNHILPPISVKIGEDGGEVTIPFYSFREAADSINGNLTDITFLGEPVSQEMWIQLIKMGVINAKQSRK